MIDSENLLKLNRIHNEILQIANDSDFNGRRPESEKIYQLLDRFVHMQSLIISIRTELLVRLFSIYPYLPHEIKQPDKEGLR
jgi:hypothetical protein